MKIRLLLVDDHAVVRSGLRMLLATEGDVEIIGEAGTAAEALASAADLKPDVILMDIGLPDKSGIEATRDIKALFPEVAIVALTIHEDEEYFFKMLEAGASGYVPKRAAPDELLTAIRAAANGEVYLYPTMAKLLVRDYLVSEPTDRRRRGGARGDTPDRRRRSVRHALRTHRRALAGSAPLRPARRAPSDRGRHPVERPARHHARRTAGSSVSCSTCSTSIAAACDAAACSTCSPICRSAAPTASTCRPRVGNVSQPRGGRGARRRLGSSTRRAEAPASDRARRQTPCGSSSATCAPSWATRRQPARGPTGPPGATNSSTAASAATRSNGWPRSNTTAYEALTAALDRLGHLDPVSEPVTRHRFRTTLEAELDAVPPRQGRVGQGVTAAPLAGAVGLDVDVAIVLGAAEGVLPPRPTSDPLLSDADRTLAGLPTADARSIRLHRVLLSAIATSSVSAHRAAG